MSKVDIFDSFRESAHLVTRDISVSAELKEKTMKGIMARQEHTSKIPKEPLKSRWPLRKTILLCSAVLLFIFILGFSNTLMLTLNQLIEKIQTPITQEMSPEDRVQYTKVLDSLEVQHRESIDKTIEAMRSGETKQLSFDTDYGEFYVLLAKGDENIFGSLWIDEKQKIRKYDLIGLDLDMGKIDSPEEAIENGKFVALLEPIPDSYILDSIDTIEGAVRFISYLGPNDTKVSIRLTSYTDIEENKELISIDDFQGIYSHGVAVNGTPYGKVSLYLGEQGRYRVVEIIAQYNDIIKGREDLIDLASNIKLYNEDDNTFGDRIHPKLISQYVSDPNIEQGIEELVDAFENNKAQYELQRGNVNLLYNHENGRDSYRVRYDDMSYDRVKEYFIYPAIGPELIYKDCSLDYAVMFLGHMINFDLSYWFSYQGDGVKKDDRGVAVIIQEEKSNLQHYPILDILMSRHMEDKIYLDDDNHPYGVYQSEDGSQTMIVTIFHIDGKYIRYTVTLSTDLFKSFDPMDLINSMSNI